MKSKIIIIFAFAILLCNFVEADTLNSNVSIINTAPNISSITIEPSPFTISANTTLFCNATLSDNNGYSDVSSANSTFWHSTSSESASDSYDVHYTNSSCSIGTNNSIIEAPISCSFTITTDALAGTWYCKITATDGNNASSLNTSGTVSVCGDGSCSTEESCSSCSSDCGICLSSSGGGGGGGSGGGWHYRQAYNYINSWYI